jgi:hypothetical protein
LVVVNIVNKKIQGMDTLFQAAFDIFPVTGFHDARNDVKGKYLFGTFIATVDSESDTHVIHGNFSGLLADKNIAIGKGFDTLNQDPGARTRIAV